MTDKEELIKLDEALETLHKVCDNHICSDGCPLYKFCQYLWHGNSFDFMSEAIKDVFGYEE